MGFRGMVLTPLVSLLIGCALNRVPTDVVTNSQWYRADRFGLRTAVERAHEHVVSSVSFLGAQLRSVGDSLLLKVTGRGPVVSSDPPAGQKGKKRRRKSVGEEPLGRGTATRLFTVEELAEYNGSDARKGPYLALLGEVFDVSKGRKHYSPGGGYGFFSGRDGSRAFVTGDFTEAGLTDDVSGLSGQDYLGLADWLQMYRRDYRPVGRLVGRYFDADGRETEAWHQFQRWLAEARRQKRDEDADQQRFPPCNSEWSQERGGRVYCSRRSGGVQRDWVGRPRQYFSAGSTRCACVRDSGPPSHGPDLGSDRGDLDHPQLKEYPGCPPEADSCRTKH